jgi:hypothetical protein
MLPIKTLAMIEGCPTSTLNVIVLKPLVTTKWVAPKQHKVLVLISFFLAM